MNEKIKNASTKKLVEAFLSLQSEEECYNFLEDLCTAQEIKSMAQRLQVAGMLKKHELYTDIVLKTGASTATISRVNRSLSYGADGYNSVLEKIDKDVR